MIMKITIEKLETLRSAMSVAAETIKVEQNAWSVLTNSKKELEDSLKVNGATPSEAQEEFWKHMEAHKNSLRKSLKNLCEREKEFSAAYEQYRREST